MTLSAISGHYHNTIYFFPQEDNLYPEHIMCYIVDKLLFVSAIRSRIRVIRVTSVVNYVEPYSFSVLLRYNLQCFIHCLDRISQLCSPDAVPLCRVPCSGSPGLSIRRRRRLFHNGLVLCYLPLMISYECQRHPVQFTRQEIFVILVRLVIPHILTSLLT